jgi:hypothetical protein
MALSSRAKFESCAQLKRRAFCCLAMAIAVSNASSAWRGVRRSALKQLRSRQVDLESSMNVSFPRPFLSKLGGARSESSNPQRRFNISDCCSDRGIAWVSPFSPRIHQSHNIIVRQWRRRSPRLLQKAQVAPRPSALARNARLPLVYFIRWEAALVSVRCRRARQSQPTTLRVPQQDTFSRSASNK